MMWGRNGSKNPGTASLAKHRSHLHCCHRWTNDKKARTKSTKSCPRITISNGSAVRRGHPSLLPSSEHGVYFRNMQQLQQQVMPVGRTNKSSSGPDQIPQAMTSNWGYRHSTLSTCNFQPQTDPSSPRLCSRVYRPHPRGAKSGNP